MIVQFKPNLITSIFFFVSLSVRSTNCAINWDTININEINRLLVSGNRCENIIQDFINRIEQYNAKLSSINVMISKNSYALEEAKALDISYSLWKKVKGPLHCVPILFKDNIDVAGLRTTAGSRALNFSIPKSDSDIVARFRAQGAVVIGKANLDTFAIGGNSSSEVIGQTLNPYGPSVGSAGSSSCGNGAGGAAVFAVIGIGSDTTGSVLSPASNANLIGFNLPHGRFSMRGVFPLTPLLDRAGPLVRYAEDLARVLDVLDPTIPPDQLPFYASPSVLNENGLMGMRLGVLQMAFQNFEFEGLSWNMTPEVRDLYDRTLFNLSREGAILKMCPYVSFEHILELTLMRVLNEIQIFRTCFANFVDEYLAGVTDSSPYHSARELLNSGLVSSPVSMFIEESLQHSQLCSQSITDFKAFKQNYTQSLVDPLFTNCGDVLISPFADNFPFSRKSTVAPTQLSFISGYPQMSLPMGFSAPRPGAPQGLPLGLYATARAGNERHLVRLAYATEKKFGRKAVLPISVQGGSSGASTINEIRFSYSLTLVIILFCMM